MKSEGIKGRLRRRLRQKGRSKHQSEGPERRMGRKGRNRRRGIEISASSFSLTVESLPHESKDPSPIRGSLSIAYLTRSVYLINARFGDFLLFSPIRERTRFIKFVEFPKFIQFLSPLTGFEGRSKLIRRNFKISREQS